LENTTSLFHGETKEKSKTLMEKKRQKKNKKFLHISAYAPIPLPQYHKKKFCLFGFCIFLFLCLYFKSSGAALQMKKNQGIIELMKNWKITDSDYLIFFAFALFWVFFAWSGFLLTLVGFFHIWAVIILTIVFFGIFWRYFFWKKKLFRISLETICLAILAVIFVSILSFQASPTIFSGRDQGSISEAGIRLAQNHRLEFSTPASQEFFKIYGPGRALNFPGFYYSQNGDLKTQFPIVYVAWLGIFFSIFGISGLIIANAILLFLFLLSFYFLSRIFLRTSPASGLLAIIATSFVIFWFAKFTLSENMALTLLWPGIVSLYFFLQQKERKEFYYFSSLALFSLLAFTRIEGFFILIMVFVLSLVNRETRQFIFSNKKIRFFLPLILFFVIFLADLWVNLNFFKEIGKALLENILPAKTEALELDEKVIRPGFYISNVFFQYGIFHYLILGIAGIIFFIRKKKYSELIPFLVVAPVFVYLFDAHISSDHPWMLRRYAFAIIPAVVFYTILAFHEWTKRFKIIFSALLFFLFFLNLIIFSKFAFFAENKNLSQEATALSQNFSNNDLVLVDRLASGDNWTMLSGPMNFVNGKNSVYFFNPNDFQKLDLKKFAKIYLIAPNENIAFYENSVLWTRMNFVKNYTLDTKRLSIADENINNKVSLPKIKSVEIKGKIFEIVR
jgi:hypothetical protein